MKKILLFAVLACLSLITASAQETEPHNAPEFWEADLVGGEYIVKIGFIHSVSLHTYTVKSMTITEVVVDTGGNSLARFYAFSSDASSKSDDLKSIESDLKDMVKDNDSSNSLNTVAKEYPITTHAKTIEYNLGTVKNVEKLFKSVKKSWISGRGNKITIK